MAQIGGLLNQSVAETPVAVLDFELIGLYAGADRVVEAVVRVDPSESAPVPDLAWWAPGE